MNIYYYLYYRLYKFAKRVGTVDATWTAMLLISCLIGLNIMPAISFLLGHSIFSNNPKIEGAIIGLIIGCINYYIFIRKDNCKNVIKRFKAETKKQKIISSILSLLYILLTVYVSHFLNT